MIGYMYYIKKPDVWFSRIPIFDALDYVTEFTFDPNLSDSFPLYIKGVPFKWIHSSILELLTITKKFSFEGNEN